MVGGSNPPGPTKPSKAVGWAALLRGFRLALAAQGLKSHTIESYLRDVTRLAAHLEDRSPSTVTAADIAGYVAILREGRAPKTVRETQLGLRRFFRWLVAEEELRRDPTERLPLATYRVAPQPTYTPVEVKRLLLACNPKTRLGLRNRALLLVLWDTGVRAGELMSMRAVDWEHRNVQVVGKTGTRNVPLGTAALQALDRYTRRWAIEAPPLWRGAHGPLTGSGVLQILRHLATRAGVPHKGAHAFRRGAAAQMKHLGMQDSDILEILGWKSVTMLRRYTASVAEELAHQAHRSYSPADHLGR